MEATMSGNGLTAQRPDDDVTVVVDVTGMLRASQQHTVQTQLAARPGVQAVEANAVAQTATVRYDRAMTSVAELRRFVTDCGMHCAGLSVPAHVCDPTAEPAPAAGPAGAAEAHPGAVEAHAGDHGGHAMAQMVADMRNRFLVA